MRSLSSTEVMMPLKRRTTKSRKKKRAVRSPRTRERRNEMIYLFIHNFYLFLRSITMLHKIN